MWSGHSRPLLLTVLVHTARMQKTTVEERRFSAA
jgi:hypothetical protein